MSDLGLVTTAGRILRAQLLAGLPVGGLTWMALGTGSWSDKTNPPTELDNQIGLTAEYGRKRVERFAYLSLNDALDPDAATTIHFNGHLYEEVIGPTAIVAYFATFAETEAIGVGICEIGLFGGNVIATTSPFALAINVVQPGTLYWVQNRPGFIKTNRDTYKVAAVFEER